MDFKIIEKELLIEKEIDAVHINNYINYLKKIASETKKDGTLRNPWIKHKKDEELIGYFKKYAAQKIYIDGEVALIQDIGVYLTYHAYKNLVLLRYPETKIDIQLVKEDDAFEFKKIDGKITYKHDIKSPFIEKKIIGAYCIIKNSLGEFIETMSMDELNKIRKTARTGYIWDIWTNEMYLKTIIRRACKRHFRDIIQVKNIDTFDNDNFNIEEDKIQDNIDKNLIDEINSILDIKILKDYYDKNKNLQKNKIAFRNLIIERYLILKKENKEDLNENL